MSIIKEPLYIEDCEQVVLNSKGWTLKGYSRAGDRTGFILYPHKFTFDCGVRARAHNQYIFMTHVHTDHSLELPNLCNRHRLKHGQTYNVHVPDTSIPPLILLERCVENLSNPDTVDWTDKQILDHQGVKFLGVNSGDIFTVNDSQIEVLKSHHTVQAVGYGISTIKTKLKQEYVDMMNNESVDKKGRVEQMKKLKKDGVQVNETMIVPELAFFCDSSIENLTLHNEWKKYPIVVCECTGLAQEKNDKIESEYLEMGHTCISQLLPIMMEHLDKKWIIIHVSTSLKIPEIEAIELDLKNKGIDIYIFK